MLGAHDGENYTEIFLGCLNKYKIAHKISGITADNAAVNGKMGQLIGRVKDVTFDGRTQLHGCVGHVINLAAKDGLKLFGEVFEGPEDDSPTSIMSISNLVDPPEISQVDLASIYSRCHGLVTSVRSSAQRGQELSKIVEALRSIQAPATDDDDPETEAIEAAADSEAVDFILNDPVPNLDRQPPSTKAKRAEKATKLIPDVPTRWNSSYLMFRRLLRLRKAVDTYCKRQGSKFALNPKEWDYVQQMCTFLEPLSEATDIMCQSRFPTMHRVLPVYVVVIQGLERVCQSSLLLQLFN